MARTFHLERVQLVRRPLEDVFAFFSQARNLEAITPDFLSFEVLTPEPIVMQPGTLIDYRLRLFGIPFQWQSRIEAFEPMRRFTDVQTRGPYRRWEHHHEFYAVPDGTLCVDRIDYELPLGPLGSVARALFVNRSLEQIFDFRRQRIRELLPDCDQAPTPEAVERAMG